MKTIESFKSKYHAAAALVDAGYDDREVDDTVQAMSNHEATPEAAVYEIANNLEEQVKLCQNALRRAESDLKAFCAVVELEPVNV